VNQMTEIETTEIETVTVAFEEFKENFVHYERVRKTNRLVITHDGEQVAVLGLWLPDETRSFPPIWFFHDLFPPEPIDHECKVSRALEEEREDRTFT
jgi:hypothetical protein